MVKKFSPVIVPSSNNLIAFVPQNWLSSNTLVELTLRGFLTTEIWANAVSVGKSLSESSNLAYYKTLSVPISL